MPTEQSLVVYKAMGWRVTWGTHEARNHNFFTAFLNPVLTILPAELYWQCVIVECSEPDVVFPQTSLAGLLPGHFILLSRSAHILKLLACP